jgi:hypothetical protein
MTGRKRRFWMDGRDFLGAFVYAINILFKIFREEGKVFHIWKSKTFTYTYCRKFDQYKILKKKKYHLIS